MKKMILMTAMLIGMTVMAQTPVITFEKTTHDFGKINEADGRVTTVFEFKNEGMSPLVLTNVRASCGCTTPKWTREPIMPGAVGEITVTYNPSGRPGRFQKTITITSNASEPTTRLYIKGEVISKPVNPAETYPTKIGELNFKKKTLNFGALRQGQVKTLEIPYTNLSNNVVTLDAYLPSNTTYIKPFVSVKEVKPHETGKIQVTLTTTEANLYGPADVKLYLEFPIVIIQRTSGASLGNNVCSRSPTVKSSDLNIKSPFGASPHSAVVVTSPLVASPNGEFADSSPSTFILSVISSLE
jgi:hypothetical protein